jgi:uracil-DNA glycosylase
LTKVDVLMRFFVNPPTATARGWRMAVSFALMEIVTDWPHDLPPEWRDACGEVEFGFGKAVPRLEFWGPVFLVRRGRNLTGMPVGAHTLRAFEAIPPHHMRCVILSQAPCPAPDFATGRAFEAGNVGSWRELDGMFSKGVRTFVQQIVAARTGDSGYPRNFANWPKTLAAIESGAVALEPASQLAPRCVDGGVLLLNASLTLSRLRVYVDPHQPRGHLPLWRPLMIKVPRTLFDRGALLVVIRFGDMAAETLRQAGLREGKGGGPPCILRDHPARADAVLALETCTFPICSGAIRSRPITASRYASAGCARKAGARSPCARPIRRRRPESGRTTCRPNLTGAP